MRALKSPSPGGAFSDQWCDWSYDRNDGVPYKKNTEVEVLPVVDLFKESAKHPFFVGGATQGD